MTDVFGSFLGPPPVYWEEQRLLGEQLAREALMGKYGRTGKLSWGAYFGTLLEWDRTLASAEYQAWQCGLTSPTPLEPVDGKEAGEKG